jgi:hypothetical protein
MISLFTDENFTGNLYQLFDWRVVGAARRFKQS